VRFRNQRALVAGTCIGAMWLLAAGCASPEPQRTSVAPGVNQPYENPDVEQWTERLENEGREVYTQRDEIVADLELRPGMDVADIGAGTGFFTLLFAEAVAPEGRAYAVDISEEFLALIEQRAAEAGLDNVVAVHCPQDSVNLPAGSIDLAFICDTYHHFEYPQSTLASLHKALRPGGAVYIIDFERVEGESSQWVLDHVRAGAEAVVQEMARAGFELVGDAAHAARLDENYFLRFRRAE
jgi:predicted methyltransferase